MSEVGSTEKFIDAFKDLDGFDPDTADEYSQGDDVFSRYVSGQYAIMRPKGAKGNYLLRADVINAAEAQAERFCVMEAALSEAVSLSVRLQNQLTHSEKVYRANSESYRAEISELRASTTPTN